LQAIDEWNLPENSKNIKPPMITAKGTVTTNIHNINSCFMQNVKINTVSELNLHPLQELLTHEIDINELINHLNLACLYFAQNSMKISHIEKTPIDEQEISCLYWLQRLKILFQDMKT
jgi:hypothetical protein